MDAIERFDDSDDLLALARQTGEHGVLSVYVNSDPDQQGSAIDIRNRLRALPKSLDEHGSSDRARAWSQRIDSLETVIEDVTRPGQSGRGRILFTTPDGDWQRVLLSQMPVSNRVVVDDGPFIHPLLELLDEGRRAGVLIFSGDQARLHEWRLGRLRPLSTLDPDVVEAPHERAGPIGGGPAGRFDSPVREQRQGRERDRAARFADDVVAAAAALAEERRWERVVVSGGSRWTEALADALRQSVGDREVIEDARVLGGLGEADLADSVTGLLHEAHAVAESRLLERLRDRDFRATAFGLSDVVGALNTGRVAHLVYDPQVRYSGYVDDEGFLFGGEELPAGVTRATPEPRFSERMVERALETGARISPVEGAGDGALAEARGAAALLRW